VRAALWAFCFIELHSFYPIKIDPLILTTYVWNSAVAKSTHPKTCVVVAFCEVACYENIHKYMQHLPLSALVSRIPCSVAGPRLLHHKKAWDHNGSGAFPDCALSDVIKPAAVRLVSATHSATIDIDGQLLLLWNECYFIRKRYGGIFYLLKFRQQPRLRKSSRALRDVRCALLPTLSPSRDLPFKQKRNQQNVPDGTILKSPGQE